MKSTTNPQQKAINQKRGPTTGNQGFRDPAVEGVHTMTNVGRGPTKGNAGRQKSGAARKGALGATSGY